MRMNDPNGPEAGGGPRRNWYRILNITIASVLAGLLLLLYVADVGPGSSSEPDGIVLFGVRVPNTCLYRRLLETECPGCGLTRALVLLLDRHVEQAQQVHRSAVWVALWLAAQIIVRLVLAAFAIRPRSLWPDFAASLTSMAAAIYLPVVL